MESRNEHEEFKALLDKAKLSREEFSELMGMKFTSVTNQLAPSKELPKWAKSVLIIVRKLENNKDQ